MRLFLAVVGGSALLALLAGARPTSSPPPTRPPRAQIQPTATEVDCSGISDPVIWKDCEEGKQWAIELTDEAEYNEWRGEPSNDPVDRQCDYRGCYYGDQ